MSAVCAKVFQKFPEFVHRCKNEAFEALSDPMYSGKMKVKHENSCVIPSLTVSKGGLTGLCFLLGAAEASQILSTKER